MLLDFINIGPPRSFYDDIHFKITKLYRNVKEEVMERFHDDPLTLQATLPFPPYTVANWRHILLNWCTTVECGCG